MQPVEIILRLVDQLTKPARAAAGALKSVGAATDKMNAGARKASSTLGNSARKANQLKRAYDGLGRSVNNLRRGFSRLSSGMMTAGLAGAVGVATKYALALKLIKGSLMTTQVEFENYVATLEAVTKSEQKAQEWMAWTSDFARTTPFEYGPLVEATTRLLTAGVNPSSGVMTALGDTAAALKKDIRQGSEAVSDLMIGLTMKFQSFSGIDVLKEGKNLVFQYHDGVKWAQRKVAQDDRLGIENAVKDILNLKYEGAMAKQAKTLGGIQSNIADTWTGFKRQIVEAGVGQAIKDELQSVLDWADLMNMPTIVQGVGSLDAAVFGTATGKTKAQKFAEDISGRLVTSIKELRSMFNSLKESATSVFDVLDNFANSGFGQAIGGWNTIIGTFVALPFIAAAMKIVTGLAMMTWGIIGLTKALGIIIAIKGLGSLVVSLMSLSGIAFGSIATGIGTLWTVIATGVAGLVAAAVALGTIVGTLYLFKGAYADIKQMIEDPEGEKQRQIDKNKSFAKAFPEMGAGPSARASVLENGGNWKDTLRSFWDPDGVLADMNKKRNGAAQSRVTRGFNAVDAAKPNVRVSGAFDAIEQASKQNAGVLKGNGEEAMQNFQAGMVNVADQIRVWWSTFGASLKTSIPAPTLGSAIPSATKMSAPGPAGGNTIHQSTQVNVSGAGANQQQLAQSIASAAAAQQRRLNDGLNAGAVA